MPKISVITPVWCDVKEKLNWLDEMIQSVQSQTITDWELILIDDKSPLPLDQIKMKHIDDTRLRWLANAENSGPSKTRNTAVALAESDCILPLDSDDMLASDEVLERMYEVWERDKSKIIYGNLQQFVLSNNGFKRSRVFSLGEYSFEMVMNLEGLMPVTAMHSVGCHNAAGGWKHELVDGLEDLEYWIAAGERGYCGQKIQHTTLLYRRQENSRAYRIKHIDKTFEAQQGKIKVMHAPIYRREFPMSCCGKGGNTSAQSPIINDPAILSAQNAKVTKISELKDFDDKDCEWVTYEGPKTGSFSVLVLGPSNLPSRYHVLGTGHCFQIHKRHHQFFSQRQHMKYRINQPDPRQQPEPTNPIEAPKPEPQIVEMSKPELSTIVSLDKIGSETRQADVQPQIEEVIIEPNPAQSFSASMTSQFIDNPQPTISDLGLTENLTNMLSRDLTLKELAELEVSQLTHYRGIADKRAQAIINKARELVNDE